MVRQTKVQIIKQYVKERREGRKKRKESKYGNCKSKQLKDSLDKPAPKGTFRMVLSAWGKKNAETNSACKKVK